MAEATVRLTRRPRGARARVDRRPAPVEAPVQPGPATYACPIEPCPCLVGQCTLSRLDRAMAVSQAALGAADCPALTNGERRLADRLGTAGVDTSSVGAIANLQRGASALRGYFERTVLAPYQLTWTGWSTLCHVWVWEEIEAHHVAGEVGISKGTLTGVAKTLERRGWLQRRTHPDDARRTLFSLTGEGQELVDRLHTEFAAQEREALAPLTEGEIALLSTLMRRITTHVGGPDGA